MTLTATFCCVNASKKEKNVGDVVTTTCAPTTPLSCSLVPNSIIGAIEAAAWVAEIMGFTNTAVSELANPPQPASVHEIASSVIMLHNDTWALGPLLRMAVRVLTGFPLHCTFCMIHKQTGSIILKNSKLQ